MIVTSVNMGNVVSDAVMHCEGQDNWLLRKRKGMEMIGMGDRRGNSWTFIRFSLSWIIQLIILSYAAPTPINILTIKSWQNTEKTLIGHISPNSLFLYSHSLYLCHSFLTSSKIYLLSNLLLSFLEKAFSVLISLILVLMSMVDFITVKKKQSFYVLTSSLCQDKWGYIHCLICLCFPKAHNNSSL